MVRPRSKGFTSHEAARALKDRLDRLLSQLPVATMLRPHLHSLRRLMSRLLPDGAFARYSHARRTGRSLDLENPRTFADKVWWQKLNVRNPLMTQCADKYQVREYVAQCGLNWLLVPVHGVFNDANDINLQALPAKELFFKTTHGSGGNRIVDNSRPYRDINRFRKSFNSLLRQNYFWESREWPYKDIRPRIVCESVLRNEDGSLPADWKIYCFGGTPRLIYYTEGSSDESGKHTSSANRFANMYDVSLRMLPVSRIGWNVDSTRTSLPAEELAEVLRYAATLSKPFAFCRVDFYIVGGRTYFGEITFSPGGGNIVFEPESWNETIGSWIELPDTEASVDGSKSSDRPKGSSR